MIEKPGQSARLARVWSAGNAVRCDANFQAVFVNIDRIARRLSFVSSRQFSPPFATCHSRLIPVFGLCYGNDSLTF
jgi:hypothetical protein